MKIIRSSKHTLKFTTVQKQKILSELIEEYSRVCNIFIDLFWIDEFEKKDLLASITSTVESWLSARAKQCAAREALSMVDGAKEKAKEIEEEPIKPTHNGKRIILSSQCVLIEEGQNSFDLWIKIHSVGKKIKLFLPLKKHYHSNKFADWDRSSSIVITSSYVQFSYERETGKKKAEGQFIGIDVGINHLLATSTGELIGDQVKKLINIIKRRKQGSKRQKKARKNLSYYLHKIVKEFFSSNEDLRLVVVENLKNFKKGKQPNRGKEFRKTLSNWNYRELLNVIQLRCEENRVSFRSVNPYKTSQQCPHCSHIERENRSGEKFQCLRCGYANHADFVGSLNILDRFLSGRYGAAFQT